MPLKVISDDHAEELPTEAGATVIISVDTLVSGEYMDSIATLSKDEKQVVQAKFVL